MNLRKQMRYYPITQRVLAVAVINYKEEDGVFSLFDWTCYVDAVRGKEHEAEYLEVARTGDKISATLAKTIFHSLDAEKYRR